MSNSPLVAYTALSPNYSVKTRDNDRITIHHMAGVMSVEACGSVFAPASRQASSNYGIGNDGRIALYVPEDKRAWTSSSQENDNRAVTIEVSNSAAAQPWPISDAAYGALIELCADICRRGGKNRLLWFGDKDKTLNYIPAANEMVMTVHRWFAATACPGDWLLERMGAIAEAVNKILEKETDDDMDVNRFKELWQEMRKELQDNDSSPWSGEAREWAVSSGLVQGGSTGSANYMWEDVLTREQMVTLLYRFAQMMGKA